jgi:hypothetical protein
MNTLDDIEFKKTRMVDYYYGGGNIYWRTVEDDFVNNVFSDVAADYSYWSGYRFRKIFLKKASGSNTARSVGAFIYEDSQADDTLSLRVGTAIDKVEDARTYSGWHKAGVLQTNIIGAETKPEGPRTREFSVSVLEDDSTGFYSNNRIYVSDGRRYSILYVLTAQWINSTTVKLFTSYDSDATFSSGARVSSICELGDIESLDELPLWIKQYIPENASTYRNSKPIIGFVGV